MEHDPNYVAMCDIGEHMSCSKAFNSKYGKGFGIVGEIFGNDSVMNQPNSVPGMVFYAICFLLSLNRAATSAKTLFIFSMVSNLMSLYLAYILYFILHDFCIVCVSTYGVNFVLLVLSYIRYNQIKIATRTKKE
ncbi:hypothetical protein AAG570_010447 [Ranatra chinensis]|uniref:vitamin-K-epoxide reductase (warfarin-sensitive) n=1 Tax=Ranatra chinensis TaxID=642074 RepID=A0ABD0YYL8_9HEMI